MPTLPITVPNVFANATSNIALSLLDADFLAVAQAINGIGNGSTPLTNVTITGGTVSGVVVSSVPISGQCRLVYVSATQIQLVPYNGQYIQIAGVLYGIPAAGISIGNGGLGAGALYFVYAYNSSGTLALEISATGSATDTTPGNVGIRIKSGDSSRSLVGMVLTDNHGRFSFGPPASDDGSIYVGVASWFNRRSVSIGTAIAATSSSTTLISLGSPILLTNWGEESVSFSTSGLISNNGASASTCQTALFVTGLPSYAVSYHSLSPSPNNFTSLSINGLVSPGSNGASAYQLFGASLNTIPFQWQSGFLWLGTMI